MRLKKIILLLTPLLVVAFSKFRTLEISISDTNVYFYTAYQILQGKELYKDILFTNLPLFPLVSVFYFLITNGNIYLYYFTAAIESFMLALLIYYVVYTETRHFLPSLLASFIFSISIYNLSTSSFQLGIFTASLFAVGSYISIKKNNPFLTGILLSLCFLTKAYFIPVLIALGLLALTTFIKKNLYKLIVGLFVGLIPLVPYLITSSSEMLRYLFDFSAQKESTINKFSELKAFLTYDFIYALLLPFMLIYKKHNRLFWAVLFVSFLIFFLYFDDFYYYYFGMIVPFLSIRAGHLVSYVFSKAKKVNVKTLLLIFFPPLILFNLLRYSEIATATRVYQIDKIVTTINMINPDYVYGKEISPAAAYLSGKPLIEGIIDTNPLLFYYGFIDKNRVTEDVVNNKTVVITNGYEGRGQEVVNLPDIVNVDIFLKYCKKENSYPVIGRPLENRIFLYTCRGQN